MGWKNLPYWLKVFLVGLIPVVIFIIEGMVEISTNLKLTGTYTQLNIIYLIIYPIIGFIYVVLMFWVGNKKIPKWLKVGFFGMATIFIAVLMGGRCQATQLPVCQISLFEISDYPFTIIAPILGFILGAIIGRMFDKSDKEINKELTKKKSAR